MEPIEPRPAAADPSPESPVGLVVHRLRLGYGVQSKLELPAQYGTSLRGALVEALRDRFCILSAQQGRSCGQEPGCQICGLVATTDAAGSRGREIPRPFALEPQSGSQRVFQPGDPLQFELLLFGSAIRYVPYIAVAARGLEWLGRTEGHPGGRIAFEEIWAVNGIDGAAHRVAEHRSASLRMPAVPITHGQIVARVAEWGTDTLTIRLRTPLRLVENGNLVRHLGFPTVLRRTIRRLTDLSATYGNGPLSMDFAPLLAAAESVQVTTDRTHWVDVESPSSRLQRTTPIGGLLGEISFAGDLRPFLPWLVWAETMHLGKDTTKGNGWIQIISR